MTGVANENIVILPFNLEELQAISDLMHGRAHVRFNPDEKWTAEKLMTLRTRVDAELALLKAHPVKQTVLAIKRCPHGVLSEYPCLDCQELFGNP